MKLEEKPGRKPGHAEASAVLTAALGTARFPASKEALVKDVGAWKIPVGSGQKVALREILEAIPEEQFSSSADAQNRIDAHWDKVSARLREAGE